MDKEQKITILRIIVTVVALIVLNLVSLPGTLKLILYLLFYLIIGADILIEAFEGIIHLEVFDEDFLMAVATIGAFALAIYTKSGDYNEAILVMLLFRIGELFEDLAVDKSKDNIETLMDLRADYANIFVDGEYKKVSPEEVSVGSVIMVNPGEKIPLDGYVVEGDSSVNTSSLTGESIPRDIFAGSEVLSGQINLNKVIKVKTTKAFNESTASKILSLIEESSTRKAKSENFIKKFAAVYTPAVCIIALFISLFIPLIRHFLLGLPFDFNQFIYIGLTFLVISCPCALVISIPLSFFAGIGGASHNGILIKGSNYMESLSKIKTVVFDKTGTLTKGIFEVNAIHHNICDEKELLKYAAMAESSSSHPISQSLINAYAGKIDYSKIKGIEEISGMGVLANIDGIKVCVGNEKLMERENIEYVPCHHSGTIVHVAFDGDYQGHIVISDVIKETSFEAVKNLKEVGINKTVMLTGDARNVAQNVANKLGINEYFSELLPADKVTKLEEIIAGNKPGVYTAFVGDGINDAPSLMRADVGIAMGALGSDAAIEAADVVIMNDDPSKISKAVKISKKCLRIVNENIVLALSVKFACLLLSLLGITNMYLAIFADVGVMIIAVLNAIRALSVNDRV